MKSQCSKRKKKKNQKRDDEKTMQNQAIRGWGFEGFEGVCATTPNCHLERAKLGGSSLKIVKDVSTLYIHM